jgi:tricarballylate dehydrogenase
MSNAYDVVVIGGGNSRFTAGLMRVAYNGVEDLKRPIPDLSPEKIERTDFGTYTEDQFLDDMARVIEYRCDPDLTEILVKKSLDTVAWMRSKGVRFTAAWGRQAGAGGEPDQRSEEEQHRGA